MAEFADREHFIPIRVSELIELLCSERGPGDAKPMPFEEQERLRHFCRLILNHYHQEYHAQLVKLKNDYAPFDPDADTRQIYRPTPEELDFARDDLFNTFADILQRANYQKLSTAQIEESMAGASYWGVDLSVDWTAFDRLDMYVRGNAIGQRFKRHWLKKWQKHQLPVPIFQRLVVILKQRPHKRLGKDADTKSIFLKLFKDIPRMDIEMVVPGTRLKMPKMERGKLGATITSSVGYLGWKFSTLSMASMTPIGMLGPVGALAGYGWKTYAGFQTTRQSYMFQLTKSLYYQNLDNNGGVFFRLLDEAEEQESREAMLAYYFLWRYADLNAGGGWTTEQLDDYIEIEMEKRIGLKIDFEVGDALAKVKALGLAEERDGRWRAVPLEKGIQIMEKETLAEVGT